MKVLKIKDNTQVKKDALSDIDILTGKIADKTLEQLEREGVFVFPEFVVDAEDITKDQMILQSINDTYVSSLIDDVFFHPMNKGGTGAQRLFDGNVGLIYPDFISRDNETRIIADAKYKPIDNIGNKDYLQVLAYMFRFDAKAGYYLYPEAAGTADRRLWMNKGSTYEANVAPRDDICLTKHGLKIPVDAENYEMFVFQMKVSEAEFRQVFAAR